jgi:hypothetical protein
MQKLGVPLLVTALLALLIASVWWAWGLWISVETEPLPPELYVALVGGVVFSLLVGGGLMALIFYSNRQGYDDEAGRNNRR